MQVVAGTDDVYALAKKYSLKTAWGSDILFSAAQAARQGAMLSKMVRWYTPAEALKMATSVNGELLAMSGPRNPYPGKLGVVEEGALADLLLVDGDPIANIKLIEDPAHKLPRHHEGRKNLQKYCALNRLCKPETNQFPPSRPDSRARLAAPKRSEGGNTQHVPRTTNTAR